MTTPPPILTMPASLVDAYCGAIRTGCEGVERGAELVSAAVASIEADDSAVPPVHCWDGILLIITHAAGLSRMLFPLGLGKGPERDSPELAARRLRGAELREWLAVQADSPLNKDGRTIRDTVEHWDEKVENWHLDAAAKSGTIAWAIGPAHQLEPQYYYVRSFDQTTMTVTYGANSLQLGPLLAEVRRLWEAYIDRRAGS